MSRPIARLVGLILALAGLGTVFGYGPWMLLRAKATESWPSVEGTVLATGLDSHTDSKDRTSWSVEFEYRYEVGGTGFTGERYSMAGNPGAGSKSAAEELRSKHPEGSSIEVYYDPDDPGSAVLARGGARKAWLTILFGAVLVLAGLLVALRNRR